MLHPDVFDIIARTRTSYRIFPNLQVLFWSPTIGISSYVTVFMHERIKEYWMPLLDSPINEKVVSQSTDVVERMPELTHLHLNPIYKVSKILPFLF